MNISLLPAYFYPTRVFMVDDNKDFLINFSLQLDPDLAYCLFSSPQTALNILLQSSEASQIDKYSISNYEDGNFNDMTNQIINIDLAPIQSEVFNRYRFDEISVAIVDYDMPGLNGIEFFQRIKNLPVKKIMLTGKADEKLAIEAFNQGLIHDFIPKHAPNVIEKINASLQRLQYNYFLDKTNTIVKLLSLKGNKFFTDTVFFDFFTTLCKEHNIVEYYLTESTGSFLLLDKNAKPGWLVVKLAEDLQLNYDLALACDVSVEVLEALRNGSKIPFSCKVVDYYQFQKYDWETKIYSAQELVGEKSYYYAYIPDIPAFADRAENIVSYRNYLEQLVTDGDKQSK